MECTEVVQVMDMEVAEDQTLEIILTLFAGLLIAAIVIIIILLIIFRNRIKKYCKCQCWICCCCCLGAVKDNDEFSSAYLIHSWDEPGLEESRVRDEHASLIQAEDFDEEALVISNRTSQFMLTSQSGSNIEEHTEIIYTNSGALETEEKVVNVVVVETSFIDGGQSAEITEVATYSFIDVFIATWEKKHHVLYCCERAAIIKLETDFHRHWTEFFLFLVETLSSRLVAEGHASEKWRTDLLRSCEESIALSLKEHGSVITQLVLLEEGKTQELLLECSVNAVLMVLVDNIRSSLKETNYNEIEVEEITSELRGNFEKFENPFFDLYLKEIEKLKNRIYLREALMEKFSKDTDELKTNMQSHQKAHVKVLEKIQMGSTQVSSTSSHIQDRLAMEVEKVWTSAIKDFEDAFNEQKLTLKSDSEQRVDKSGPREKFNIAIQIQKEKFTNGKKTVLKFIDSYCGKIRKLLDSEAKNEIIEINFTATELNGLIELLGVKFFKKGIQDESDVYSKFKKSSSWIAPDVVNMISQLNADLEELPGSLRVVRQKQEGELRAILNTGPPNLPQDEIYFSNVILEEDFVQKMLDVQVDLSEVERAMLADRISIQMKCYKLHLELGKLSYERRLKYTVRGNRVNFSAKKSALLLENMAVDSNIRAMVELNWKEQNIDTAHQEAIESAKKKLSESLLSARNGIEVLFQIEIERIRRHHEKNIDILSDEEKALSTLKTKLLERFPSSTERDRLLKEHQMNISVLDEELQRSRKHQEQVLQQKIQARKLEKMEEGKRLKKQQSMTQSLYTVGSANKFAANCLVALLMEVRHKRSLKELEEYHTQEGEKLKKQLKRRYEINTKHSLQFHEKELIVKLAAALNMTRKDLEKELAVSMADDDAGSDLHLTQSILGTFDKAILEITR